MDGSSLLRRSHEKTWNRAVDTAQLYNTHLAYVKAWVPVILAHAPMKKGQNSDAYIFLSKRSKFEEAT